MMLRLPGAEGTCVDLDRVSDNGDRLLKGKACFSVPDMNVFLNFRFRTDERRLNGSKDPLAGLKGDLVCINR